MIVLRGTVQPRLTSLTSAAIPVADIAGYSALMGADGAHCARAQGPFRQLFCR